MSDPICVNGNSLSWGSLTFKVNGIVVYGFTDISFNDKRERVKGYSMGRHQAPVRRSRGKYTSENLKVTGYTSSVLYLRQLLAAQASGGKSYGDVFFEGNLNYFEPDDTEMNYEFRKLVWAANDSSHAEGPELLKQTVEFDCMWQVCNGLVLFDQSDTVLL